MSTPATFLLENQSAATGPARLIERPGTYLWSTAGTFGGGTVALQYLAADGATWTALRTITAGETSVIFITEDTYVRAVSTGGGIANITSSLRLGSGLAFDITSGVASIGTSQLVDANVTNAKLANMTQATVKGRAAGAGTGVPVDLTGDQLLTIQNIDGAWTTAAAVVSAASGTFTSATGTCRYKKVGRIVCVYAEIVIVTNGTAAGAGVLTVASLPAPVTGKIFPMSGRENAVNANLLNVSLSGQAFSFYKYDNTYPGVNGAILCANGIYETNAA